MKRPRVYGSEPKFRRLLARHVAEGEELLDRVAGVRSVMDSLRDVPETADAHEDAWARDLRRWWGRTLRNAINALGNQAPSVLPTLVRGLPPETGKPRHRVGLGYEDGLRAVLQELHDLQAVLGVRRGVTTSAPPPARFEELHASGLVDEKVIKDHARAMISPGTPKQLADAIGSAKELTEATLRAALDRLSEPWNKNDDLPKLMRTWRRAIGHVAPPDPKGKDSLDKAHSALANVVTFVAEWRGLYGSGHGRPEYPPGLAARHARLAADAAETCVRFIATTMDELELLPPRSS